MTTQYTGSLLAMGEICIASWFLNLPSDNSYYGHLESELVTIKQMMESVRWCSKLILYPQCECSIRALVCALAVLLLIQFPANVPGKEARCGTPAPT